MSKLTTPEKWHKDTWFRKLKPDAKLLFLYVCDVCDIAGFWEVDLEMAAICIGYTVKRAQAAFKQIERAYMGNGKVIWLKNYLKHQKHYPLKSSDKVFKPIMDAIDLHADMRDDILALVLDDPSMPHGRGIHSVGCPIDGSHTNTNTNTKANSNTKGGSGGDETTIDPAHPATDIARYFKLKNPYCRWQTATVFRYFRQLLDSERWTADDIKHGIDAADNGHADATPKDVENVLTSTERQRGDTDRMKELKSTIRIATRKG